MPLTINKALSLLKIIRYRIGELKELRSEISTKETFMGQTNKIVEPQYDVKTVDRKIVRLEKAIFEIDSSIKGSNAIVQIDVSIDENEIFEPLT